MSAQSQLYTLQKGAPLLNAVKCRQCSYVDFPPQDYGCRQCGAFGEVLQPQPIAPDGKVTTSAEVHHFPGDKYELPFTIAVVALDAGPVTRVTMRDSGKVDLGTEVTAVVVGDGENAELRYVPKETAHG